MREKMEENEEKGKLIEQFKKQLSLKKLLAGYLCYVFCCIINMAAEFSGHNRPSLLIIFIGLLLPIYFIITKEEFYKNDDYFYTICYRGVYLCYLAIVNILFLVYGHNSFRFQNFWSGKSSVITSGGHIEYGEFLQYIIWLTAPFLITIIVKLFLNKKILFIESIKNRLKKGLK